MTSPRRFPSLLVAGLALLAPGSLAGSAGAERTASAEYADGRVEQYPFEALSELLGERLLPVVVRFEGAPAAPVGGDERVELGLLGGDRLGGRIGGGEGERLFLELSGAAVLTLPIDAFVELVFPARIPADPGLPVEPAPEGDRLYRRVADRLDRVDGAVEGFTAEGVRFDGLIGSRVYPWAELAALFVEPLVEPEPLGRDPRGVVVDLTDGSRLRGLALAFGSAELRLEVRPAGQRIALPWSAVRRITAADGRIDYLGELAPARAVDASPFGDDLGMVWPHRVDRAVHGEPLRAGGRVWARGLGVHAPSRLEWALDGRPAVLRGAVAIDDSTARLAARGSVVFRVELDGEPAFVSPVLRGGDRPLELPPLDLDGVGTLALVVETADQAHVADRADWLDLRLVR